MADLDLTIDAYRTHGSTDAYGFMGAYGCQEYQTRTQLSTDPIYKREANKPNEFRVKLMVFMADQLFS